MAKTTKKAGVTFDLPKIGAKDKRPIFTPSETMDPSTTFEPMLPNFPGGVSNRKSGQVTLKRKISFSLTQTKFKDALNLWHPLKEGKKGPNLNDIETIEKMRKAKRFPIPERLIHMPKVGNFDLNIDSIMHCAYANDEIDEWAEYKQEVAAPCNSQNSMEDLNFASSSEGSLEEVVGDVKDKAAEKVKEEAVHSTVVKSMKTKKPKRQIRIDQLIET